MKERFYEQRISVKPPFYQRMLSVLLTVIILCGCFFAIDYTGMLPAILLALVLTYALNFFVLSRFRLEYEYELTNDTLQIDAIYNKTSRKTILSVDLSRTASIEPYSAPRKKDGGLRPLYDCTSRRKTGNACLITLPEPERKYLLIEPDETLLAMLTSGRAASLSNPYAS